MAPYLFWEFIILIVGVWVMAVLFFVYGWLLLKKQRNLVQRIEALYPPAPTLPHNTQDSSGGLANDLPEKTSQQNIVISKDEPISKYKDMSPSEDVTVSFVDKNE